MPKKSKIERAIARRDAKRHGQVVAKGKQNAKHNSDLAGGLGIIGAEIELDPRRLPACLQNHKLSDLIGTQPAASDDGPSYADSDQTSPAMEAARYESHGDEVYEAAVEKLLASEGLAQELAEWEGMIAQNEAVQEMTRPQLGIVSADDDDDDDEEDQTREAELPETDEGPNGDGDDDGDPVFADDHPPVETVTVTVLTPEQRLAACRTSSVFPARKGIAAGRQHEINSRTQLRFFSGWDVPASHRERTLDQGVNRWRYAQNRKAYAAAAQLLERLLSTDGKKFDLSVYWQNAGDFVDYHGDEASSWKLLKKKCEKFAKKGMADHQTVLRSLWEFVFNARRQRGKITHFEYNVIASDQDAWKSGFLADLVACDLMTKANARTAMRMFKLKAA